MNLQVTLDQTTAAKVAEYFECAGMAKAALNLWNGLYVTDPYNQVARERLADLHFEQKQSQYAPGSIARSRMLLGLFNCFPTKKLTNAYFANLGQLLKGKPKRSSPGKVVIGTGTGRCGSTTLCAAFAGVPDSCATHENPPLIYWEPAEEQVQFQMRRLRYLADYFPLVFDAAHWWLNTLDTFFAEFPEGKVVGLRRDNKSCIRSFLNVKGTGAGSYNHWALPNNGIWRTTPGDTSYPSYPVPPELVSDPDAAKAIHVERYVTEYNQTLESLAKTFAGRLELFRTEEMSDSATAKRMSSFVGLPISMPEEGFNVGNTVDSEKQYFRY